MGHSLNPSALLITYLIGINLITFMAIAIDKALAQSDSRRISEASLLSLALFGGALGAYAARHLFRHKTRKQPFSGHLHLIATIQIAVVLAGTVIGWDNFFAMLRGFAS